MLGPAEGGARRLRRRHGLQPPLHPLQVTGWLAAAALAAGAYLALVPALPPSLQPVAAAAVSAPLLLHLAAHAAALLVDPAEPELRAGSPASPGGRRRRDVVVVAELDREKHAHAIEAGFCHLCQIRTSSPRTKHCSTCNKCVDHFDHHCKWLNHCVGRRNYAAFLMCVSTAVVAATLVALLAVAELVIHHVGPGWLARSPAPVNGTADAAVRSSLPTGDAAFLAVVAALGLLAAVTAGLLLHLCFFHIYISFLGLTTYEYIRQQRQSQQERETQQQIPEEDDSSCSVPRHRPVNLSCSERTRTTLFTCAVLEESFSVRYNRCSMPTPTPPSTPQECHACVPSTNSVSPGPQSPQPKKRSKTRWNCCVSVPDSPEDPRNPTEPRCLISLCRHKVAKCKGSPLPAIEGRGRRTHGHWSSAKLRVLFRVLGNLGGNRRRHQNRTNQVVPSPSAQSAGDRPQPIHTIQCPEERRRLPPLPALAPPPRRRLVSEAELAHALAALQQRQRAAPCVGRAFSQYGGGRRRRRGAAHHRPKTPALSPIRESGLSNPASPSRQTCAVVSGSCQY